MPTCTGDQRRHRRLGLELCHDSHEFTIKHIFFHYELRRWLARPGQGPFRIPMDSDGIDSWADTGFLDLTALQWAVCGLSASPGRAGSRADCFDLSAISVGACGLSTWYCVSRPRPTAFFVISRRFGNQKREKHTRGRGGCGWHSSLFV